MRKQISNVRISHMQSSNLSHGQLWYLKERNGMEVTQKRTVGHLALQVCQQEHYHQRT